jgi:hypothetical protein
VPLGTAVVAVILMACCYWRVARLPAFEPAGSAVRVVPAPDGAAAALAPSISGDRADQDAVNR